MLPDDWGFGISVDGTKKAGSACDIETQEYIFRMITASSKFGRYSGRLDFAGAVGGVDREMGTLLGEWDTQTARMCISLPVQTRPGTTQN